VRPNGAVVVAAAADVAAVAVAVAAAAVADGKPPATRPSSSWAATGPPSSFAMLCTWRLSGFLGTMTPGEQLEAPFHLAIPHLYANSVLLLLLLLLLLRVNANFADLHANVACTNIEVYCQSCRRCREASRCPCCCLSTVLLPLLFVLQLQEQQQQQQQPPTACWPGDHSWVSCARTVKLS